MSGRDGSHVSPVCSSTRKQQYLSTFLSYLTEHHLSFGQNLLAAERVHLRGLIRRESSFAIELMTNLPFSQVPRVDLLTSYAFYELTFVDVHQDCTAWQIPLTVGSSAKILQNGILCSINFDVSSTHCSACENIIGFIAWNLCFWRL